MYNEELKTQFIRQYTTKISTADFAVDMFNYLEQFENKYGSDYACMTKEQASDAVSSIQTLRASSMESRSAILKAYVRWNIDNGTENANKELLSVEFHGFSHIRSMMVKDPAHLARILNKVYAPVKDGTVENLYRFYIWMFYSGMKEDQIFLCKRGNIDYKRMEISVGDQRFPIYREELDVIVFCADAKEIAERNPLMVNVRDTIPRRPGDELYRGARNATSASAARVSATTLITSAYNNGLIDVKLTRKSVRLSGIFYRMYEREMNGVPVDFTEDAINEMRGKTYKTNDRFTIGVKRVRIIRDFELDYANWKEAFNLE